MEIRYLGRYDIIPILQVRGEYHRWARIMGTLNLGTRQCHHLTELDRRKLN